MIDLKSEDDLWKLFRTTDNGHEQQGERAHEFRYLWDALYDRKTKKPAFKPKCDDRFYYLSGRGVVARVPQSALLKVGRAIYARDKNLTVHYLGTRRR